VTRNVYFKKTGSIVKLKRETESKAIQLRHCPALHLLQVNSSRVTSSLASVALERRRTKFMHTLRCVHFTWLRPSCTVVPLLYCRLSLYFLLHSV